MVVVTEEVTTTIFGAYVFSSLFKHLKVRTFIFRTPNGSIFRLERVRGGKVLEALDGKAAADAAGVDPPPPHPHPNPPSPLLLSMPCQDYEALIVRDTGCPFKTFTI